MAREDVIIIGGGIGGLTLALCLQQKGISFKVYEAAEEIKPLGVGLNLLPHAMRDLAALGMDQVLCEKGIETKEYAFYTSNGQHVFSEPRGLHAGYPVPQVSLHRGDLHMLLLHAVKERAGDGAVVTGHKCVAVGQTLNEALISFVDTASGEALPDVRGRIAIACDGVNSVARAQLHPNEAVPRYEGTPVDRWAREDFVRYTRDSGDKIAECRSVIAPNCSADGVVGSLRGAGYRALCAG